MDPELTTEVLFLLDVIVVGVKECRPLRVNVKVLAEESHGRFDHREAILRGVAECPTNIIAIRSTPFGLSFETL